jgi:hypothetical protein
MKTSGTKGRSGSSTISSIFFTQVIPAQLIVSVPEVPGKE